MAVRLVASIAGRRFNWLLYADLGARLGPAVLIRHVAGSSDEMQLLTCAVRRLVGPLLC